MFRHRDQLKKMQCSIDNRPPAPQPHLQLFGRDYFAKKRATTEAAFQDLKMIQNIARTMTRPIEGPRGMPSGPIKSLNHSYRKKELFRITMENHLLLERLEKTQPEMNNQKLEEEATARRLHMINCSYSARRNGLYDDLLGRRTHRGKVKRPDSQSTPNLPAIEDSLGANPNALPSQLNKQALNPASPQKLVVPEEPQPTAAESVPPAGTIAARAGAARRVTGGDADDVVEEEPVEEDYEDDYEEEFEKE
eukprot:g1337.t1